MEENRFLGNIYGHGAGYAGAVWDKESIAPTLTTMQGGGREPMIVEAEQVHLEQEIINPAKGLSENGWHYEQNLYAEESPLIRTIKAGGGSGNTPKVVEVKQATKDGYIPCDIGGVCDLNYPDSTTRRGRVQGNGQICPTLTTENTPSVLEPWIWEIDGVTYLIRIRKLTPRECWRLMSFTDEDFEKAQAVNSNTQLYKQAGNSIVKEVMCNIFRNLIGEQE